VRIVEEEWREAGRSYALALAAVFGRGRVWLAGDAAHLGSPRTVQSMNAGLREGAFLADSLDELIRHDGALSLLDDYGEAARAEWRARRPTDGASLRSPAAHAGGRHVLTGTIQWSTVPLAPARPLW
jgi:2-polyprenyl-6-methoxyphenol hydroxylase-like FAD-dependent oxidoreductase